MKQTVSTILAISIIVIATGSLLSQKKKSRFFSEEETTINTENGNIYGTLLIPKKVKTKIPVALIIAGSGPTDRDGNNPVMKNNSLKMMAEGLGKNKIASLRYDKRGIAKSKEAAINEKDIRFDDFVTDAAKWIEKLKQDNRFSSVIVIGHSEGSLIGMIAGEKSNADKYISLAGVGNNISVVLKEQLKDQPKKIKEESYIIIDSLAQGDTVVNINQNMKSLFRKSVQAYLISWLKYEPQIEIKKLNIPILLIQGTTDMQVSVDEANLLKKAYPKAELEIIENMNHVLKESTDDYVENMKTYYTPDIPLKEELIEIITKFILDE